jgi:CHASE3 domain sensor protein
MDPKLQQQIDEIEIKITDIQQSTKKTEKYMQWTFWVTILMVVVPLVIAVVIVPIIISRYLTMLDGLL